MYIFNSKKQSLNKIYFNCIFTVVTQNEVLTEKLSAFTKNKVSSHLHKANVDLFYYIYYQMELKMNSTQSTHL